MKRVIIGIITVVLVVFGLGYYRKVQTQNQVFDRTAANAIAKTNRKVSEIAPHYVTYSQATLAKAQGQGRTVLFFHAPWCPTCRALDTELQKKSQTLPADVTILQVDYDTEKALKQHYNVVTQHTLVQIDANGNEIKKWIGGNVAVINQELQ